MSVLPHIFYQARPYAMDKLETFNASRYRLWIDDQVRFGDLDAVGHVNNNAISQYFENARAWLYMDITPEWPRGDGFFVLARTAIDFKQELNMPAKLKVGTVIMRIGRTSLTVANALFHDDKGIAYCESVSVFIDRRSRQPIPVPDAVRQRCERHML